MIAREHRLQRGQALPSVMVIMVLLSLIAGGLAIAVSGALSQQALSKRRVTADVSVQNSIEVAAARIQNGDCSVPPASSLTAASAPRVQSAHPPGLPPTGGAPRIPGFYCLRVDGVDTDQVKRQTASPAIETDQRPAVFAGTCLSTAVPFPPGSKFAIWLQVGRPVATSELGYGLRTPRESCSEGLNGSQVGDASQARTSTGLAATRDSCSRPITQRASTQPGRLKDPPLTQVGFTCSLSSALEQRELSLSLGKSMSSTTVWMAPAKPRGGSVTMVAAPTGVSAGYEESQLASTGSGPQLLYEEALR